MSNKKNDLISNLIRFSNKNNDLINELKEFNTFDFFEKLFEKFNDSNFSINDLQLFTTDEIENLKKELIKK